MDERQLNLIRATNSAWRDAGYAQYRCDSLMYECIRNKIRPEEIAEWIGLSVQAVNRRVHDFSVRLEEAS